jgi:hypothetical protein
MVLAVEIWNTVLIFQKPLTLIFGRYKFKQVIQYNYKIYNIYCLHYKVLKLLIALSYKA